MPSIILVIIILVFFKTFAQGEDSIEVTKSNFEFFPIISYDSNTGLGYGLKVFLLGYLSEEESFDLILFNSTKGERWYRFKFSTPESRIRQGKKYDYAVDFILDYDKWIHYSFFGLGNNSLFEDEEVFTKTSFSIYGLVSKGFTNYFSVETGIKYGTILNSNYPVNGLFHSLNKTSRGRAKLLSILINLSYDTRNDFYNPANGILLQTEYEISPEFKFTNTQFNRISVSASYFSSLIIENLILALRLNAQKISGSDIPVQCLLPLGGNNSLRGFTQDRFIDNGVLLFNTELRFPIYRRLGGIAGFDAGKVWSSLQKINLNNWAANPAIGLRFYMDNFVVRADVGFGPETTGLYFNFGHIF